MVSYCLHLGLRTSALTLREEAGEVLGGSAGAWGGGGEAGVAEAGESLQPQVRTEGLSLWRWFKLARSKLAEQGACRERMNARKVAGSRRKRKMAGRECCLGGAGGGDAVAWGGDQGRAWVCCQLLAGCYLLSVVCQLLGCRVGCTGREV